MRAEALRKGRADRKDRQKIQETFDAYLDYVIEKLVSKGVDESDAMEAVFYTAEFLAERGALPPFPETVNYRMMAEWVVGAADFGFIDFMVEAV